MVYFASCSLSDYMFRLSSLGHHHVVFIEETIQCIWYIA